MRSSSAQNCMTSLAVGVGARREERGEAQAHREGLGQHDRADARGLREQAHHPRPWRGRGAHVQPDALGRVDQRQGGRAEHPEVERPRPADQRPAQLRGHRRPGRRGQHEQPVGVPLGGSLEMADGVRSAGDDDQVEARRQIRNPVCDGHPARIAERPDGVRQRPDELGRAGQPDAAGPDETPDRGALGPALALLHDRARLGRPLDREVDDHVAVGQRGFDAVAGAAEDADHPAILRQHLGEESPDAPLAAHLGQVLQEQARDAPALDIVTDEERDVRRAVVGGWRARDTRPDDVADDRDDLVADRHDQSDPIHLVGLDQLVNLVLDLGSVVAEEAQ